MSRLYRRCAVPLLLVLLAVPALGFLVDSNQRTCFSCSGIASPQLCLHLRECSPGQLCFEERVASPSGMAVTYNLGCRDPNMCEDSTSLIGRRRNVRDPYLRVSQRDVTTCSQCCDANLCNKDVCHTGASTGNQHIPASQDLYIRLVNGLSAFEGTVEVFHSGHWGSICDDSWDGHDAAVVCYMLGYSVGGATGTQGGLYRPATSTTQIWLDEVQCIGNETSLVQCHKSAWGVHDCSHGEDAGVICTSVSYQDDVIYLLDTGLGGLLVRMNLVTQSFVPIPLLNVYHPTTFDYDPVQARLYFADGVLHQILSVRYDGTDVRELRQLPADAEPEKVEVDPVNRLLFFTDDGRNVIASMGLDGSNYQEVVTSGLDKPREIVLDPRSRQMYWSDWGKSPKIEKANYDGSGRQTLAESDLQWPNGMAIDYDENKLYFVDGGLNKIEVMGLDGSNRHVILHDSTSHFFAMDVFDKYIYYTDWSSNTVMRVNKDGTGKTSVGPPSFRQLADIRVHEYGTDLPGVSTESPVHFDPSHVFVRLHGPATQGYVEVFANGQWGTICDDNWDNNDAAVICRMVGLGETGAQAVGNSAAGHGNMMIALDEVGCAGTESHLVQCPGIDQNSWGVHDCSHNEDAGVICSPGSTDDNFLLFNTPGLLNRMSTSSYSYTVVPVPNSQPNPIAIAYDPDTRRIFFTEVMATHSEIYSADLGGGHPTLLRTLPSGSVVDGLEVDTVNNLLFYTDTGSNTIRSAALDGSNEVTIISSDLDEPRAIVADPVNRVIYWTDWGSRPKIERANYDGSNRQTLVSTGLQLPNGLELDRTTGVLYFCDAGTHMIESVTTSGANRQVIFQDNAAHFFDLFLTPQYIYYSDWHRDGVMRINRDGTNQQMVGPPSFDRISGITGHTSG